MVAQSHGANRVALVFGTMLTARTNGPEWGAHAANSSSSAFASFRSSVSKPSVNHPYAGQQFARLP